MRAGLGAVVACALVACWDDAVSPDLTPQARFSLAAPMRAGAVYGVVPVNQISLTLRRANGQVAIDTTVVVTADADSAFVDITVPLTVAAGLTPQAETFEFRAALTGVAGDTLFLAGPQTVTASPSGPATPIASSLRYVGVGSNAQSLVVTPPSTGTPVSGDTVAFAVVALDGAGSTIPGTPVVWSSIDSTVLASIRPDSGVFLAGTRYGSGSVVARLLTGQADTASASVYGRITVTNGAPYSVGVQVAGLPGSYRDITTPGASSVVPVPGPATLEVWECIQTICAFDPYAVMPDESYSVIETPNGMPLDLSVVVRPTSAPQMIAAGSGFTCALSSAGKAYCWGANSFGRLGDGSSVLWARAPVAVGGGLTFASLMVAQAHACGLEPTGAAYCWGWNRDGEIGDGTTTDRGLPTLVSGGLTFSAITGGFGHTCGLTTGGAAYCWGRNNAGQLGDGSTTYSSVPVAVSGGLTFSAISAGGLHTCGLTAAGQAYCWGNESYLGNGGAATDPTRPFPVAGGLTFTQIGASGWHTCGVVSTGAAYCWGDGSSGQLGDGGDALQPVPTPVVGGLSFASIHPGRSHTCARTTAGGAYCWGLNSDGALGDGTTIQRSTPVAVSGGQTFAALTSGYGHTCGLTSSGAAFCWGQSGSGQLGDASTGFRSQPTAVAGGLVFTSIDVGRSHGCGLSGMGAAYCWGSNGAGEVGDGTTSPRSTPVAVTGAPPLTQLGLGLGHSCALDSGGAAYCWGNNGNGQVGDGTTGTSLSAPTAVTGGLAFAEVFGGAFHTCGLTVSGAAYCWGSNALGQVGDGSTDAVLTAPTAVAGGLSFVTLSSHQNHTCGLTSSGSAYCWGQNQSGQLGDGTLTNRNAPAPVAGGLSFSAIDAGASHTCAVTATGVAYCWGSNFGGALGDGTTTDAPTPTQVAGGLTFSEVTAGFSLTCGLAPSGQAYCWGDNRFGALGDGTEVNRLVPQPVVGGRTFTTLRADVNTCGLVTSGAAFCWGQADERLGDGSSSKVTSPRRVAAW